MSRNPKQNSNTNNVVPESLANGPGSVSPVPIPYPNIAQTSRTLPPTLKHQLEANFNTNLKDVEIHENHAPAMIGAKSFTSGNKIFFAPGAFNVMAQGKQVMAHECAHVIQQQGGYVNKAVQSALDSGPEE
jgi:hypothetical protein